MGWWGWWRFYPVPAPVIATPEPLIPMPPLPEMDVIQRGENATRLLADPTLARAFAEVRGEGYRLWLDTGPLEIAKREELYRVTQALDLLRQKLVEYRGAMLVKAAEREAEGRAA